MNEDEIPVREPLFRAPWPAVAVPVVLVAAYLWQSLPGSDVVAMNRALSPIGIAGGRYETLLTYQVIHAGWAHLAVNSLSAFAFGPPVARCLGASARGVTCFFAFFLICGVLSGLGYVIPHWGESDLAVGASGAISGLWGAASRLLIGRGQLAPITNRMALTQGAAFMVVNVVVGLLGGLAAMNIAWEAHVAGYIAGLLLIGPAARLAGRV